MTVTAETRAALSAADVNDLPDSDFAYIEPGGTKDSEGKTTPRSKRHFPIHDAAHVRNALARLDSSPFGEKARPKVMAAAKEFGIDVSESKSAARPALELLKRRRGSMIRKQERRGARLEMRAKPDGTGGTTFEFEGYGSVFDAEFEMWDPWGDPYREVVRRGAFAQTLARPDLDVPFLIGHDDSRLALARTRNGTMQLSEDSHGLLVRAVMDGRRSDVRDLAYAVERGDMDEMSIGFVTEQQRWSDDWMLREMLGLNLHRGDVSSVPLAASPATAGASMVALPTEILSRQAAEERAQDQIVDTSKQADFNVATDDPADNGAPRLKCPYTRKNGCGQMLPGSAKFCPNCGGPVYDGSGTLVVDDSGVVEASEGDADLLAANVPNAETLSAWLELERVSA